MQTRDQIRKNIRELSADVDYLQRRLDAAVDNGDDLEAESVERILNAKEGLLVEQEYLLDCYDSNAARYAAEDRIAFHAAEGTLDLY
jgi:hypothetical protein